MSCNGRDGRDVLLVLYMSVRRSRSVVGTDGEGVAK
jgi:hypothetical protein